MTDYNHYSLKLASNKCIGYSLPLLAVTSRAVTFTLKVIVQYKAKALHITLLLVLSKTRVAVTSNGNK
jgi:hypothetical protein